MADFTGTNADETIAPTFVSPTVTATGGTAPSDAADFIDAGAGNDIIKAGGGDDVLIGGAGNDIALLGEGNDRFVWNPGDGSDLVEGEAGFDTLEFNGSNGKDVITITANGQRVLLTRDVGNVSMDVAGVENIVINAGSGNDVITAGNGLATLTSLTIDGGAGNDTITGGDGADVILGGDGNDTVAGGRGNDVAFLGTGNDRFVWNPGDGSDIVEGQGGTDTLQFNASNASENIDISANGSRTTLFRNVGAVTMDLNSVERIEIAALAGSDNITVNDLTGTGVKQVAVNLAAVGGLGDAQVDTVSVNGTAGNDTIGVKTSGTSVVVTGLSAQVTIDGAEPANDRLVINGLDGNDTISAAALLGGQINLVIDGGDGNDTITGSAGSDILIGGIGNDVVTGGLGNDTVFLGDGDDRFISNPGNGSAVLEGDAGIDILEFNGASTADTINILRNGTRVALLRDGVITMDVNGVENIVITAGNGDDLITAGNGLAGLTTLTIDGGNGNDTITGGDGADVIMGGSGDDIVAGGRGNDVAFLGTGNDVFIWNPGDGSDTVEGQSGTDTLLFNGANISENIDISANGQRTTFFRNIANVTMDFNGIERIEFAALGGADNITVNDLTGTSVKQVAINLAATGGGDGQADTVTVNGTAGNNNISVITSGASIVVTGLPAQVSIDGAEGANDSLVINGSDGNDTINASALGAGLIKLVVDGGAGKDTIVGTAGADVLRGGDGNDVITGGAGADVAFLGDGNDRFVWNPGDGSDVVEGETGFDTLAFNGSDAAETISIGANGQRVSLFRDAGSITMDLNGIERIELDTAGGADTVVVGDLTGTSLTQVAIDLAAAGTNHADGVSDQVMVNGTNGADVITIDRLSGAVRVSGLAETVTIAHADGALDTLTILAGQGDDVIDASALPANQINLVLNGGIGNDTLIGSQGNDTVIGGSGTDVALLGAGDDRFIWNPGDGSDVVNGQAGFDTLQFNGSNIGETIGISANGPQATFTRDIAAITMNLTSVERVEFTALGGADKITVNDLTGTGVKQVAIELAAFGGADDNQPDTVTVNGTAGNDSISVTTSGSLVTVGGLPAQVTVDHMGIGDLLAINGGDGNDTINASAMPAGPALKLDAGAGNDTIMGGAGNDLLLGGVGNDTFVFNFGNTGSDVIADFQAHSGGSHQADVISLKGFSDHSFDQLVANGHIAQSGADVVISDGTNTVVTLQNTSLAFLHANDFLFG